MRLTFDPVKDQANRLKHGLSLADAPWVFDSPDKLTLETPRGGEARLMDLALVEWAGVVLVLVYLLRPPDEVRAISLRRASRVERRMYEAWKEGR